MNRPLVFLLFLSLATAAGCGGDRQTYANVKGTVTYNSRPVEKGEIVFTVEGKPATVIEIVDGKFEGQALVGSNRVAITARKKAAKATKLRKDAETQIKGYGEYMKDKTGGGAPPTLEPGMVDYIPPEWGSASKHMRVVETGAANEFDFNIKGPS
jgi:hypothetical protein